ncbi:MAG: hypothetical protein KDA58_05085, partial [Planctomycetaceae bacterium]|nr:hypothetical protein [Planctomycetaceae bacterium]
SHPDFGIFLSDRDVFIQQHFFSGAGQIAYVVDPVRHLEGVFEWRSGKPELISHYWIGSRIMTAAQSQQSPRPTASMGVQTTAAQQAVIPDDSGSMWHTVVTALAWCCLFLLGVQVANTYNTWERNMLVAGAVAHYGNQKVLKTGLSDDLLLVRNEIVQLHNALATLPTVNAELSKEEQAKVTELRRQLLQHMALVVKKLESMESEYGLSPEEKQALLALVADKQAALRKRTQAQGSSTGSKEATGSEESTDAKSSAEPDNNAPAASPTTTAPTSPTNASASPTASPASSLPTSPTAQPPAESPASTNTPPQSSPTDIADPAPATGGESSEPTTSAVGPAHRYEPEITVPLRRMLVWSNLVPMVMDRSAVQRSNHGWFSNNQPLDSAAVVRLPQRPMHAITSALSDSPSKSVFVPVSPLSGSGPISG